MALQLRNRGIERVRPLLGGLDAWLALEFPTEAIPEPPAHDAPSEKAQAE